MRLLWLRQAKFDLFAIHDYIALRNPSAASRITAEITEAAIRLKQFPLLGRPADEAGVRLLQASGLPYLLPYRVTGDIIQIIAVIDERMERPPEWL